MWNKNIFSSILHLLVRSTQILQNGSAPRCKFKKGTHNNVQFLASWRQQANVELAIGVFHEITIAAAQNYFLERLDIHNFLKLVMCWWLIANSTKRYTPNVLSNAVANEGGKMSFYLKFADWVEDSFTASHFCLTKQTASALFLTLRSQAMLIQELYEEEYEFVLSRVQSDVVERRFSQYRMMRGGRFLVGLREVRNSEGILKFRSCLKIN